MPPTVSPERLLFCAFRHYSSLTDTVVVEHVKHGICHLPLCRGRDRLFHLLAPGLDHHFGTLLVSRRKSSADHCQSSISLTHIFLHESIAYLRNRPLSVSRHRLLLILHLLRQCSSRVSVLLWLPTCGFGVMFTVARQPVCKAASNQAPLWRLGETCILQRISLGAAFAAL